MFFNNRLVVNRRDGVIVSIKLIDAYSVKKYIDLRLT